MGPYDPGNGAWYQALSAKAFSFAVPYAFTMWFISDVSETTFVGIYQPQMLWPHGFFRMEPDMRERVMSGLLLADSLNFTYDLEELQQTGTNPHHEVL